MQLDQVGVRKVSQVISAHVDLVTCLQCLKYFTAPETAACGHSLCHLCWVGCTSCPTCHKKVIKKSLLLNMQIRNQTDHIRDLVKSFEQLFGIKMDEMAAVEMAENNQNQHVKEWLSSSQNHFSAPPYSETQTCTQDVVLPVVEVSPNNIQVHAQTSGSKSGKPPKVVHVPPPQDDWDMIETVPDTEEIALLEKNKRNVVGPMDLEPFLIDDNEYTARNPRRSSRMRDNNNPVAKTPIKCDVSADKQSSNNSSLDTEKKLDKAKQNWTNVKKMRKEFSKLNKENKNKLNVSIEMCKKSKSAASKQASATPPHSPAKVYTILEDTPNVTEDVNANANNNDLSNLPENDAQVNETRKGDVNMTEDDELPDIDFNEPEESTTTKTLKSKLTNKHNLSKRVSRNVINKGDNKDQNKDTINPGNETRNKKIPFMKKSTICNNNTSDGNHTVTVNHNDLPDTSNITNDDDIHITIKIGSVITNIIINKKRNDVQLNVNSDKEVQASLGPNPISYTNVTDNKVVLKDAQIGTDDNVVVTPVLTKDNAVGANNKSCSTKKHTASADTTTANYEITESVEKELSKVMECDEADEIAPNKASLQSKSSKQLGTTQRPAKAVTKTDTAKSQVKNTQNLEEGNIDDLDIFNSGSVKEVSVQALKRADKTQSEILVPTHKTKSRTQKSDKRSRDVDDGEQTAKRQRIDTQEVNRDTNKLLEMSSENANYAAIMSQVFANIDADMKVDSKTQTIAKKPVEVETQDFVVKPSQVIPSGKKAVNTQVEKVVTKVQSKVGDQKESENMFSTIGNIDNPHVAGPETQKHIDNLLTDTALEDIDNEANGMGTGNDAVHINATPAMDDDSDKSVVEDTPQKNNSKSTNNRTVVSNKKQNAIPPQKAKDTEDIINLTDSIRASNKNDIAILENNIPLKTPLTINKFVDEITHKSTPFARKSLNFTQNEMETDDDVTLCPSVIDVAKTTQEKELMKEAFASTPKRKPLQMKNVKIDKKFVVAGSCLTSTESTNLKILCFKMKWSFVDKYSPDLTHLVVGVDNGNKAQRSVKYMCALAAGKWIVSYKWVERCLESNTIANEDPFEALDSTGEPGPRRSRCADRKVFDGMTFHCMPPFTLLDVDTLKAMLEAAGARVVSQAEGACVKGPSPALLLAEPAHTEEDKYIYFAMDLQVVPVNYEWALNCLGSYGLCSLMDLLLCPPTLLPEPTKTWPQELLAVEE